MKKKLKPFWEDSLYISCECGCEVLRLSKWNNDDDIFDMCMFASSRMGLWCRIKQAFKYLIYGEFYYNEMILSKDNLEKMSKFIINVLEERNKEK